MTRLSVNINKIATLRNARGGNTPDVLQAAIRCEAYGADGITVHPRPDERHIRRSDIFAIRPHIQTEYNIEGYPSETFLQLIEEVKPDQVTLVPDPPEAVTSNTGWNTRENVDFLTEAIKHLKPFGCRISIFVDADPDMINYAAKTGTDRIELYTEAYAVNYHNDKAHAVRPFVEAAKLASQLGLGINAGHDLSLDNLAFFNTNIPDLAEVSIGHALISDALYYGLENTIQMYKRQLQKP
ncbi:MAG: pyridoxine 5'-phosphate synthase [Bacteroidota bacterium]|nr:pyridoxine 5'-phosphate synthase [Bacteroidota bacterium]